MLLSLYQQSLQTIQGQRLTNNAINAHPEILKAHTAGTLRIFAVGKAAASMAAGARDALPGCRGIGVTKEAHAPTVLWAGWEWLEAGHPLPNAHSLHAAEQLFQRATDMTSEMRLLLLLSGGASAMLAAPINGISLTTLIHITNSLMHAGASIHELNTVRRRLSLIKGGGLLRALAPAQGWTFAISDVAGDTPAAIGSGISIPSMPTPRETLEILTRYQLDGQYPEAIDAIKALNATQAPTPTQMPMTLLANNQSWCDALATHASAKGLQASIIPPMNEPLSALQERLRPLLKTTPAHLLICGGEPTLRVTGKGKGGRMQHLAMCLAKEIRGRDDIAILAASSDGTDGPTDVAGALIDGKTWSNACSAGCDGDDAINQCNGYAFHQAAGSLIHTGPTGTNVCDILLIAPRQ